MKSKHLLSKILIGLMSGIVGVIIINWLAMEFGWISGGGGAGGVFIALILLSIVGFIAGVAVAFAVYFLPKPLKSEIGRRQLLIFVCVAFFLGNSVLVFLKVSQFPDHLMLQVKSLLIVLFSTAAFLSALVWHKWKQSATVLMIYSILIGLESMFGVVNLLFHSLKYDAFYDLKFGILTSSISTAAAVVVLILCRKV